MEPILHTSSMSRNFKLKQNHYQCIFLFDLVAQIWEELTENVDGKGLNKHVPRKIYDRN